MQSKITEIGEAIVKRIPYVTIYLMSVALTIVIVMAVKIIK